MKNIFRLILLCFFINTSQAQSVVINIDTLDFGNVFTGEQKTITLKYPVEITAQNSFIHKIAIPDSTFSIEVFNGSSHCDSIKITFHPTQNISYNNALLYSYNFSWDYNSTGLFQGGLFSIPIKAQGVLSDTAYSFTQNLSQEFLKIALRNHNAAAYNSLGYNIARDSMFMIIDNQFINGMGADSNTLESIYTGEQCLGYANRQAAQTNCNFNTEHTWPQSFFNSNNPMVSDLHHLFPTDNISNGIRSNYPFGWVINPTWSVGGSKYASGKFEPRDQQKGATARAVIYFATKYGNLGNYLALPQENDLRDWIHLFPADSAEVKRNNKIEQIQHNRNWFIDHPEFIDRINSFADSAYEVPSVRLVLVDDTINIATTFCSGIDSIRLEFFNDGNIQLVIDSITTFIGIDIFYSNISSVHPKQIFSIELINGSEGMGSTIIYSNSVTSPDTIFYKVTICDGVNELKSNSTIQLYPNPTEGEIKIDPSSLTASSYNIEVRNILGQKVFEMNNWHKENVISLPTSLNNGIYLLQLVDKNQQRISTPFVIHR